MLNQANFIKRQRAPREFRKIWEVYKGKNREGISATSCKEGTHTTLRCSCCDASRNLRKTAILAVSRLAIEGIKALFGQRLGYRYRITSLYLNELDSSLRFVALRQAR
jgi:hypothetical protein